MMKTSNPTSTTHTLDILHTKTYGGELEAQLVDSLNPLSDISDDDLARRCIRDADHIVTRLRSLAPYLTELRERFRRLDKNGAILGCTTWTEFIATKLDKSMRQVQRVLKPAEPEADTRHNVASPMTPTGLTEERLAYFDREAARHKRIMEEYEEALASISITEHDILLTYTELRERGDEEKVVKWAEGRKGFKWAMERLGLPRAQAITFPSEEPGSRVVAVKDSPNFLRKKINLAKPDKRDQGDGLRPRKKSERKVVRTKMSDLVTKGSQR